MSRLSKDEKKVGEFLDELESFMNLIKNEHELYFLGLVKGPPSDKARELRRRIYDMDQMVIMNTGQEFKRKVLRSRYNTLSTYWTRTLNQIEAGTYSRLRRRLAFRQQEEDKVRAEAQKKAALQSQARAVIEEHERKAAETVVRPPPPAPERAYAIRSEGLFDAFVQARQHTGEPTQGLTAERLRQTLQAHEEGIKRKFGCTEVAFRVLVENGKATIKAVPRR